MIKYIIYFVVSQTTNIPCPYAGNPDIKCSVKQHTKTEQVRGKSNPLPKDSITIWIKANPKAEIKSILPENQ